MLARMSEMIPSMPMRFKLSSFASTSAHACMQCVRVYGLLHLNVMQCVVHSMPMHFNLSSFAFTSMHALLSSSARP